MPISDTANTAWTSMASAVQAFMSFLPALLGAIVVLIVGWFVSTLLARLIHRGLTMVGFERAMDTTGFNNFVRKSGSNWTTSRILGELVKWFVFLIFVQAAANLLAMPQVTSIINSIILYIPNVFVALLIVVAGSLLARFVAGLVRGSLSEMGIENPEFLARLSQIAIVALAVIAAIDQLGIFPSVIHALLNGLVVGLALAFGLAFGLGGKDVAGRITEDWYDRSTSFHEKRRQRRTTKEPPEERRKAG